MSAYAVFRDAHSHCCLRVAEKNGRVEYITIVEDNSEIRVDVLKMDMDEFYATYQELPNYPVKRAAEHYRNPITAAILVSEKAMTHLSNISGETPMNTEQTAATETKKTPAAPAKKAAPAPAKKTAPPAAPVKGGKVISTKAPTEAAKKNVAATKRASIKDGAEPKAAPVVRKQPTAKEQAATAKAIEKEKAAAKDAAAKEKQQAKEEAAATKAAAKGKVNPAKLKQAREAAAKTKPKAKTPPSKAAKLVRNPNHKAAAPAKAAKKGAGKKEAAASRASFSDNQVIKILVDKNPKREGSNAYDIFELLKKSATVGAFYKKGGASSNLRWNIDHGYISVK